MPIGDDSWCDSLLFSYAKSHADADGLADGITNPAALDGTSPIILLTSSADQARLAPGAIILSKPVGVEAVEEALIRAVGKPSISKRTSAIIRRL